MSDAEPASSAAPENRTPRRSMSAPSVSGRRQSATTSSRRLFWQSLIIYIFRLFRDFTMFLVRGGLSTLMFCMDLVVGWLIFIFDTWLQLPGAFIISYMIRAVVWTYQVAMWVVYTMIELILYLPAPILLLYGVGLIIVYTFMPRFIEDILFTMFWSADTFIHLMRTIVFGQGKESKETTMAVSTSKK